MTNDARAAVLGAGNGGQALAFHLASTGCDVLLWAHPDHAHEWSSVGDHIEAVAHTHKDGADLHAAVVGSAPIAVKTLDPAEAMAFADLVFLVVPAFAHEGMFRLLMPYLRDEHVVVLLPGDFSVLRFMDILRAEGVTTGAAFAEAVSIPYCCRLVGAGEVFIYGVKETLHFAARPAHRRAEVLGRIADVFPIGVTPLDNVLASSFSGLNMIAHPATMLLNAGRIADGGHFYFYREGVTEAVGAIQQACDDERRAIGSAYDLDLAPMLDMFNAEYGYDYPTWHEFFTRSEAHNGNGHDAPATLDVRNITEDVPYQLVPMHGFAAQADVPSPVMNALITLAGLATGTDYFETGRTLTSLGLVDMTPAQLHEYVD